MVKKQRVADRFVISDPEQDLLGRGGMGEVYRATDTLTGATVAVKALNPAIVARSPELLERFRREGEALQQLNHPNIVRSIAAVEDAGRHYLVMEYLDGGSLADLLAKEGCLPGGRVAEIALDLADALTRAHRLGILHRDLKPANVLLAADGTPRLADFGIAHLSSGTNLTQTGVLVGTVDYLSPEACRGDVVDERADIWSFGVLLFEMLTGQAPFGGESLTAKLTAILTQPVPDIVALAPQTPDALADLVYRMLEKDPQQRIPSMRLVGAELEAILKGREIIKERFASPTPAGEKPKHNIPAQVTPFVGRQVELTELVRLLDDPEIRLVTILGLGGMGKTRLAVEAGIRILDRFEGGVYFVSLAPIQSEDAIIPAIAQATGFTFYASTDQKQQLIDYLRLKHILLILDNFEHLQSAASQIAEIMAAAPKVKLLVTSRVRLNLEAEHLYALAGMDIPDLENQGGALEYSSFKLFLVGARKVQPGYELSSGDIQHVTRICRLVGGMPLAILLAAAWLEMLTPAEVAAEIQAGLDFLSTDLMDVSVRQRSIRSTLDYSWNLLSTGEQDVFQALAVFRGGFTRQAAQSVAGASLRDLMGLVNKSLLHRSVAGRYDLHELLRQYGLEKLSHLPSIEASTRERHCGYYVDFMVQRRFALVGQSQKAAMMEIAEEIDNIKASWDWAVTRNQVEALDQTLESLSEFFYLNGWYTNGIDLFSQAAEKLACLSDEDFPGSRQVQAKILLQAGRFSDICGKQDQADQYLQTSLEISQAHGDLRTSAYALSYLGGCERLYGRLAGDFCEAGMEIFRSIGDIRGEALALRGLGWTALHTSRYASSKDYFQRSLDLYRLTGDQAGLTTTLGALGYVNWILGDFSQASQLHQEMLLLCQEIGNQGGIARALGDLGIDEYGFQRYDLAKDYLLQSLALYREIGNPEGIADVLGDLGQEALATGDYSTAIHYAQEGISIFNKRWTEFDHLAWELRIIGSAYVMMGDYSNARDYLYQALIAGRQAGLPSRALLTLIPVALLLHYEGQTERALEYLFLVRHHPFSWQMARDHASAVLSSLEENIPENIVIEVEERGRMRDLESVVTELLSELSG